MNSETKKKFIIDFAFIVVAAAIAYFVLKYAVNWLMPFIIGFIVALIIQRPVEFLSRKTPVPRAFWSTIGVFIFFALVLGLIVFPCVSIYNGVGKFAMWVQSRLPEIKDIIDTVGNSLNKIADKMPSDMQQITDTIPSKVFDGAASVITTAASSLAKNIISYFPGILLSTVISIVASCFTSIYYEKIRAFVLSQFSEKNRNLMISVKKIIVENVLKMIGGYALILLITFLELLFGLLIFDIEYAVIIALLIAVFDILPVVGTGTILIPWIIIDFITGRTSLGMGLLVLYLFITIVRNIIEPKIIGKQIGLFPLVTLLSMYLGLQLFGLYGMVAFPLTFVVLIQLQNAGIIHIWNMPPAEEEKEGFLKRLKKKISEKNKDF